MNGFIHFIGVILSVIATGLLINISISPYKPEQFYSFLVFGVATILLYSTSTLYHWLRLSEEGIKKLRKADHIMIFISIASSYTPICILVLRSTLGWSLLVLVWLVAVAGSTIKIFWMNAPRWLSTFIYLLMGWLAVIVIVPLFDVLQVSALIWLFVGGIFFTVGAVIYAGKRPDPFPGNFGFHEIFHIFVLLGSFSHFVMVYKYVAILN